MDGAEAAAAAWLFVFQLAAHQVQRGRFSGDAGECCGPQLTDGHAVRARLVRVSAQYSLLAQPWAAAPRARACVGPCSWEGPLLSGLGLHPPLFCRRSLLGELRAMSQ